jgi:hypothetical protein
LIWEYPRATPGEDQMDFVESMEVENGLIVRHCVYWGWLGVKVLDEDRYHHSTAMAAPVRAAGSPRT